MCPCESFTKLKSQCIIAKSLPGLAFVLVNTALSMRSAELRNRGVETEMAIGRNTEFASAMDNKKKCGYLSAKSVQARYKTAVT